MTAEKRIIKSARCVALHSRKGLEYCVYCETAPQARFIANLWVTYRCRKETEPYTVIANEKHPAVAHITPSDATFEHSTCYRVGFFNGDKLLCAVHVQVKQIAEELARMWCTLKETYTCRFKSPENA